MKKLLLLALTLFVFIPRAYALEECTPSDEYLEYLKLSEEERANSIEPIRCKEAYNRDNNDVQTIIQKNLDTLYGAKTSLARYSSVDDEYITSVKDQYGDGTCWAFAASSVLEANALKKGLGSYDISEAHMAYSLISGFYSDVLGQRGKYNTGVNGGRATYVASYLFNNKGMLTENELNYYANTEVKYIDGAYRRVLKNITNSQYPQGHNLLSVDRFEMFNIDGIQTCTFNEIYNIKKRVVEHGAVLSGINSTDLEKTTYFINKNTTTETHAITIVGWDDSITKDHFEGATQDGAWIAKNSWGSSWADNGYFYLSYDDVHVCNNVTSYQGVSTKNYDYTYNSSDMVGTSAYQFNPRSFFAMKFTKQSANEETIKKISYSTAVSDGINQYKIYITFDSNWQDFSKWTLISEESGSTIGIDSIYTDIPIESNEYTIIVEYYCPSSFVTFMMSKDMDDTDLFTYETGRNYYSYNLTDWRDFARNSTPVEPSLYVYTDVSDVNDSSITINDNETINEDATILLNNSLSKSINSIKVYNGINDITNQFTINSNNNEVTIKNTNKVTGLYKVVITDSDNKKVNTSVRFKERITIPTDYSYDQDRNIIFIPEGTSVESFKDRIVSVNTNYHIYGSDNNNLTSGVITNGSTLETNSGIYYIMIKGDADSNGVINSADLLLIVKYLKSINHPDVFQLIAADATNDGIINSADLLKIVKYLKGAASL